MSDGPDIPGAFVSLTKAARYLGVSKSQMKRLQDLGGLYEPAVEGMPGAEDGLGSGTTLYHAEQLRVLEAAMIGATDLETAAAAWEVHRRKLRRRVGKLAAERPSAKSRGSTFVEL